MPFYKFENEELVRAAERVSAPGFELTEEFHAEQSYPIDGWYWFANTVEAMTFFAEANSNSITPLQGLLALNAAGLTGAFVAWKSSLDPITDFDIIAYLDKASRWERDHEMFNKAATALGLTSEHVDMLFEQAKLL